jgi:tetratricopeptide (TPR) repeat protein
MNRKLLLVLIISIGVSSGCSDSFLNVENPNELTASSFYTRLDHFELALNGTYDAVKNLDLFGQTFYIQTLLALPHESDYWNAQNRNEVTSADGNVYIAWRGFYRVVARANDLIGNAPGFIEKYNPTASELESLNKMVAEARFLRAYAYFHMVRLWGEASYADDPERLAVPLILKVAKTRDEMMVPRATVGEVYEQILIDLEAAEDDLPPAWDPDNIARVTSFTAKAFLGQVHLYMEQYPEARSYFEEILASNSFQLVPANRYDDLFQGKYEFSPESLWEINYTVDMAMNIWENGLGSGIALVIAAPERGWSNCTPHGVNIDRFGTDPRLGICTYAPTDLVATVDGTMEPAGESEFNFTGHSFRKYNPRDYCVLVTNRNSGTNYHMMRLADVYLMYAEILNHDGEDGLASEYVNKVRRRAYGFSANTPEPTVDYAGLAGNQLRDSIREERFRELFGEGHRWYDIVRWKIVEEEVGKYNVKRVTGGDIIFNEKDYYYPVPLQEIDNNKKMTPSTGY